MGNVNSGPKRSQRRSNERGRSRHSPRRSPRRSKTSEVKVIQTKGVKNFLESIYGITGSGGNFKIKKIGNEYMIDANIN